MQYVTSVLCIQDSGTQYVTSELCVQDSGTQYVTCELCIQDSGTQYALLCYVSKILNYVSKTLWDTICHF